MKTLKAKRKKQKQNQRKQLVETLGKWKAREKSSENFGETGF